MSRRVKSQIKKYRDNDKMKLSLGILALVGFCSFLIVIATFTQLSFNHFILPLEALIHPIKFWTTTHNTLLPIKYYEYIPQIPVIIYISTLLGSRFGSLSVLIYIILGLTFFPIFALGGGISYLLQYNFGYILAYLPAVFVVNKNLNNNFSYTNIVKSSFLGVITIHLIGIAYIIIISLIKKESLSYVMNWIFIQSISKLIYDFIFSFLAIILAKFTKKFLWMAMG